MTTAAEPAQAQPTAPVVSLNDQVPRGKFRDGICDCFSNMLVTTAIFNYLIRSM